MNLPADVLFHIADLLPVDHVPLLVATCVSWQWCLKDQLKSLTPFYLDHASPRPYPQVTSITAPLNRAKLNGTARYQAPIRSVAHLSQFPSLTSLDISGQDINPLHGRKCLPTLKSLSSLLLNECLIDTDLLLQLLTSNTRLTRLSLAGVRIRELAFSPAADPPLAPTPSPSPAVQPLLAGLATLTQLRSLNLDARTALVQKHNQTFASFQHTTTCLPLLSHASYLTPLTLLTALALTSNRITHTDLTSIAALPRLRSLALSFLLNDHRLALSTAALSLLHPLTLLTSLTLRLHGTSREEGSLEYLPSLHSLTLTGCHNVMLAISITSLTRLTHLDISESGAAISHDLLLHLAASLPTLHTLTLDRIRCTSDFELPADSITRGLVSIASSLRSLSLDGLPLHGTGFRLPPPHPPPTPLSAPAPTPFPLLTALTFNSECLLRSRYCDLAQLTALRALTLTNYPRNELETATRHGCLTSLSALSHLTSLVLSAPNFRTPAAAPAREPLLSFLTPLTTLQHLSLGPISSHGHLFSYLPALPHLVSLNITGCLQIDASGLHTLLHCTLPSLQSVHLGCLHWPSASTPPPSPTSTAVPTPSTSSPPPPSPSPHSLATRHPTPPTATLRTPDHHHCDAFLALLPSLLPSIRFLHLGSLLPASAESLLACLRSCRHLRHVVLQELSFSPNKLRSLLSPVQHLLTVEVVRDSGRGKEQSQPPHANSTAWARYRGELVTM